MNYTLPLLVLLLITACGKSPDDQSSASFQTTQGQALETTPETITSKISLESGKTIETKHKRSQPLKDMMRSALYHKLNSLPFEMTAYNLNSYYLTLKPFYISKNNWIVKEVIMKDLAPLKNLEIVSDGRANSIYSEQDHFYLKNSNDSVIQIEDQKKYIYILVDNELSRYPLRKGLNLFSQLYWIDKKLIPNDEEILSFVGKDSSGNKQWFILNSESFDYTQPINQNLYLIYENLEKAKTKSSRTKLNLTETKTFNLSHYIDENTVFFYKDHYDFEAVMKGQSFGPCNSHGTSKKQRRDILLTLKNFKHFLSESFLIINGVQVLLSEAIDHSLNYLTEEGIVFKIREEYFGQKIQELRFQQHTHYTVKGQSFRKDRSGNQCRTETNEFDMHLSQEMVLEIISQ